MQIFYKILASTIFFGVLITHAYAQDSLSKKESPFSFNTDIVSSYIWRGSMISNVPNIQPYFSFSKKGIEIGSWGSAAINGDYSELDIYAAYTFKTFKLLVTDYYVFSGYDDENYFSYANNKTAHSFEGTLSFTGTDKLPLKILAATFFYGYDKNISGNNYYSTYFEATYSFKDIDIILGATPSEGLYADDAGLVNAGFTAHKEIKITEHFSIPSTFSLMANPSAEKVFFVAGFTF